MSEPKPRDGRPARVARRSEGARPVARRLYVRPAIRFHGEIRSLVLSPSLGTFESGLGTSFKS